MGSIEYTTNGWQLTGGGLVLDIDGRTGNLAGLLITREQDFLWTDHPGDVAVRDDLLRKTFDHHDLKLVTADLVGGCLTIRKVFKGAPWMLVETYQLQEDAIQWKAQVILDDGAYRSCAISYHLPWPQPLYPIDFWVAKEHMPSSPHRYSGLTLEYGEVTSGILIPALAAYHKNKDAGLLITMPFDFRTPRLRYKFGYRDPDLEAEFDWLALSPGKPAQTSLLFCGTRGNWRPALGWLYQRFNEYFEPRSSLIHRLWGGHISGRFNVSPKDARVMSDLGMKWHEIHAHFPAYGNYHPEGIDEWVNGHYMMEDDATVTVEMMHRTMDNLHAAGIASFPYMQLSGDADGKLLYTNFPSSQVHDYYGNEIRWEDFGGGQLNSDLSLPFGQDIVRQIDGIAARYPEMDGIFVDQACYNWLDTAHDDGITAVNNRPCYMTSFNYYPHLEHLASVLHPENQCIIGNGAHCIGLMKYLDGFMAEGTSWLCDHFQWYGLAKPMFFLLYEVDDRNIERMFQRCLMYAAGFTSYPQALASKDLYDRYLPLLTRLFRRKWVFDPDPLKLPIGYQGNIYRGERGTLLASIVNEEFRIPGRQLVKDSIYICTADSGQVRKVTLQHVGGVIEEIPFYSENGTVQFDIPGNTLAAVAELHTDTADA